MSCPQCGSRAGGFRTSTGIGAELFEIAVLDDALARFEELRV